MNNRSAEFNEATLMAFSSPTREDADTNSITAELSPEAAAISQQLKRVGKLSRTMVFENILLADRIPSIRDINLILASLGFSGLYLSAFDKEICRHNAVIVGTLEYFAENPETDGVCRIKMLNKLLADLSLKAFSSKPEYIAAEKSFADSSVYGELFNRCYSRTVYVNSVASYNSRNELIERYARKTFQQINDRSLQKTKQLIAEKLSSDGTQKTAIGKLFADDPALAGRELVIAFGVLTGCDLKELSRLLIEANHPMLCPLTDDKKLIEKLR